MTTAAKENARTLAAALGIAEDEATALLAIDVLVTTNSDRASTRFSKWLVELLRRTVSSVVTDPGERSIAVEVILGDVPPRSSAPGVWVSITGKRAIVSRERINEAAGDAQHDILVLLCACYAAAAAVHVGLGGRLPYPASYPLVVDLDALLGDDIAVLDQLVDLGECYLAGAGAIGNGLLLGLSALKVKGTIHVCDPDTVSDGNLNRCYWFDTADLEKFKAARLVDRAQPHLPGIHLIPHNEVLAKVPAAADGGAWLERLIVGVDSRRARRGLQREFAREVFDASTTGIAEFVLHFNQMPTRRACMSCVYHEAPDELAHEGHVAQSLGVELRDAQKTFVDENAAAKIAARFGLDATILVGLAYDSLFKQLCGQEKLRTVADKQVLAPFGFVSAMAGVYLALELVRRARSGLTDQPFNYWRVSPWCQPQVRLRVLRSRRPDCEFCGDGPTAARLQRVVHQLWGNNGKQERGTK